MNTYVSLNMMKFSKKRSVYNKLSISIIVSARETTFCKISN